MFCAASIGGCTLLQPVVETMLRKVSDTGTSPRREMATFIASLISGTVGIRLLNSQPRGELAGRTLDLTLFAVSRALDVLVGGLWKKWKARRIRNRKWSRVEAGVSNAADPVVFSLGAGIIMFAWIYLPDRLPR